MAEPQNQFEATGKPVDEFARLAVCHLEGALSADDAEKLRAMLADDPARRKEFVTFCLHARLIASRLGPEMAVGFDDSAATKVEQASETLAEQAVPSKPALLLGFLGDYFEQGREFFSNNTPFALLVSAAVMGTLLTLLAIWAAPNVRNWNNKSTTPTAKCPYVARVSEAVDAQWDYNNSTGTLGNRIAPDVPLELTQGLIQLEFSQGTTVIIQGPASFIAKSQNAGYLQHGTLLATVPKQAIGFALKTPHATITDLGTQFGVWTDDIHSTEVTVLKGLVEVAQAGGTAQSAASHKVVEAGSSVQVSEIAIETTVAEFPQKRFRNMLFTMRASKKETCDFSVHFPLDEPRGRLIDSRGHIRGSRLIGRPAQGATGKFGGAYAFNETSYEGDGVNLTAASAMRPTDDFTITLWFNPAALAMTNVTWPRLVDSSGNDGSIVEGLRLMIADREGNRVVRSLIAGTEGTADVWGNVALQTDTWYFVALRYDKEDKQQLTVLAEQATIDAGAIAAATANANSAGAIVYPEGTGEATRLAVPRSEDATNNNFSGLLDDVGFFNHVLTDEELALVANYGVASLLEPNTDTSGDDPRSSETPSN